MATQAEVFSAISGERNYQDARWGVPHERTPSEFLLYMQDYLTEAIRQSTREPDEGPMRCSMNTLHTIRKITALGVACMEQHGAPKR